MPILFELMTLFLFQLLDGLVDIYMPDFKFWTSETSERLCKAKDYPEVTRKVIKVIMYFKSKNYSVFLLGILRENWASFYSDIWSHWPKVTALIYYNDTYLNVNAEKEAP